MIEGKTLRHVLHGHAVYFVLRRGLRREQFLWMLSALARRGERTNDVAPEDHWHAIERRMTGGVRWDTIVPLPTQPLGVGVAGLKWMRASAQTVENILKHRPFTGYCVEGLRYTVDVFNPRNELAMPYRGAGEPVVVVLFQGLESEPGPIALHLVQNSSFYEILKDFDGVLEPEHVCGTYSLMSVLLAYLEGRVDPSYRPWEFLFPLHVLKDPPIEVTEETRISGRLVGMLPGKEVKLAKVEDWGDGRVLIQTRAGLDAVISWEYFAVAKALEMTPVQQLIEGNAPPGTAAQ